MSCKRLQEALEECHRRFREPERTALCKHTNRKLASCLIATVCPAELEAVQDFCASSGTAAKRSNCREAQLSLAVCLSLHQAPPPTK
ncbi:unnamed protein product [Victoria cruziana]